MRTEDVLISVILPLYGNEKSVQPLLIRLKESMVDRLFEVVAIDDESPDESGNITERTAKKLEIPCTLVRNVKNLGQHASILIGLRHACGAVCVIMDADLQDPPEVVPRLIELLKRNNASVAFACRRRVSPMSFEALTSLIFKRIILWILGSNLPVGVSGFAALTDDVKARLSELSIAEPFILSTMLSLRLPSVWLYYSRFPRSSGESGYTFISRCFLAYRVIKYTLKLRFRRNRGRTLKYK
jgi:glycosyltransferase involved in cell wall biosynthesis